MKKTFLALLGGVLLTFSVQAQDTTTESRKATAGNIALEANLNLFNGNDISLSNNLNQIKGRYFLSDDMALRLGVNLNYLNDAYDIIDNNNTQTVERKNFSISLNPGIEKHFGGTERLSPYVGAELSLRYQDASSTVTLNDNTIIEYNGSWHYGQNRGNFSVGLNGLAGFDYYLAKNFFIGYELGLGLNFRNEKDVEITSGSIVTTKEGDSSISFGPSVLNGIRVGFVLK